MSKNLTMEELFSIAKQRKDPLSQRNDILYLSDIPVENLRPGIKLKLLNGTFGYVFPVTIRGMFERGLSKNGVSFSNDDHWIEIRVEGSGDTIGLYHNHASHIEVVIN